MDNLCLFTFLLVSLSTCLPGLTGQEVNIGVQGFMGIPYLFTCRPVNLSSCLPGLTGPEVNIGVQGIMGISLMFSCRSVDMSRGKYIISRHYGYSVLVHLSTCLPGLTGLQAEEMSFCVWLLLVSKMAYCSHF